MSLYMSWICQSTTSGRGTAPAGLANPAEEINPDKFNNALQSNCVLIYQSQVNEVKNLLSNINMFVLPPPQQTDSFPEGDTANLPKVSISF